MVDSSFFIFLIFAAFIIFLSFTKTGKSISLGGKITHTASESIKSRGSNINSKVSVHFLGKKNSSGNIIGIEISKSSRLSFNQKIIALNKAEFQALTKLIKEAEKSLQA